MAAVNPGLGRRGGRPETAILPPSRSGAASVTTNPVKPGQADRLGNYIFAKARQQYGSRMAQLAAQHGVVVRGPVTDPAVLFRLRQRAAFASQSVQATLNRQIAQAKASGGSVSDLLANRADYKPDQVFTTEVNTADQMAVRDFYDNHPELNPTGHVEPTDSSSDECADWIDAGTLSLDQFPAFPLHVNCPHGVEPDAPPPDTELVPAGSVTNDGSFLSDAVTVATATAAVLNAVQWWVAGMVIASAMGDQSEDQTTDDNGDEEESVRPILLLEKKSRAEKTAQKLHQHLFTVAIDLDDTALKFPEILAPLVRMLVKQGAQVGVITGNETLKAQVMYRKLGYPEPRFYVTHSADSDPGKLGKWKAEQCESLGVNLMIDDFRHGDLLKAFMKHKPDWCLPLVVPFEKGAPLQMVGAKES